MSVRKGLIIGIVIGFLLGLGVLNCAMRPGILCPIIYPLSLLTLKMYIPITRLIGITNEFTAWPLMIVLNVIIFGVIGLIINVIYNKIKDNR